MSAVDFSNFDSVREAAGLNESASIFRSHWEASQTAYEAKAANFLSPEWVGAQCAELAMQDDVTEAFLSMARVLAAKPALQRFVYHCYFLFVLGVKEGLPKQSYWPKPQEMNAPDMVYACALLAGCPDLRARHAALGIEEAVSQATLRDLERWVGEYRKRHGIFGFDETSWLDAHFELRVFELGRLQFERRRFGVQTNFYRHKESGLVLALAPPNSAFRKDGQYDGVNDCYDRDAAWASQWITENGTVRANPISVDGRAIARAQDFQMAEWELLLEHGDMTLGVHIPEGGPLDYEACQESYRAALDFFPKHFPEHAFKAFDCFSWLLDHQFEDYLAPTSNILRFMRDFYIVPAPDASDWQTLDRAFDGAFTDVNSAPTETSLHRSIVEHIRRGKRWRTARGVRFPQDLDQEAGYYRRLAASTRWRAHGS